MTEEMCLRQWAVEAAIEAGAEGGDVLLLADSFVEYVFGMPGPKADVA